MSLSEQFNVGARIKGKVAFSNASFAPTSNGAALTTADGVTVDRNESGLRRYYSAKAIVAGTWTAGSSQNTQTLTLNFQHSSDGTSWDNFSTGTAPSAVWGSSSTGGSTGTTGGTAYQTVEQSVNLNGARRYVRIQIPVPTFTDCSSGRSLSYAGVLVFGGADELPAQ